MFPSCPGLRNPAQLQRERRGGVGAALRELSGPQEPGPIAADFTIGFRALAGQVVRASETRPNCSVRTFPPVGGGFSGVVRASETRPNCSKLRLVGPYVPLTCCPGLRNPAQLQQQPRPDAVRAAARLSGPQKPGPIAAAIASAPAVNFTGSSQSGVG